jgi:hypothetical protein
VGNAPDHMRVMDLATKWRADAATLRRYAATAHAELVESLAAELEAVVREEALEELTLQCWAEEHRLSYSAVQKMVARGALENVGTKGNPRVRRGDAPKKARLRQRSIAHVALLRRAG